MTASPPSRPKPPPLAAPAGVDSRIGWATAAMFWQAHLPLDPAQATCGRCQQRWPCWSWHFADYFLSTLHEPDVPFSARDTMSLPRL